MAGTGYPIQDISLSILQMQNIDFEGLFGNIHMVISFSKQLLSTLEASDAIGMNSAVTFSQQAGMGFVSSGAEQSSLNGRRVSLGLGFLPSGPCYCSTVQQQSRGDLPCPIGHYAEKHSACGPLWPLTPKGFPLITPVLSAFATQALGSLCLCSLCSSSDHCPNSFSLGELD